MRKKLYNQIKQYLAEYPKEIRKERNLTQGKMSEYLAMDVRSYIYLEQGKSAFSLLSFLLLLWEAGDKKFDIIEDIMYIISKSKDDSHE